MHTLSDTCDTNIVMAEKVGNPTSQLSQAGCCIGLLSIMVTNTKLTPQRSVVCLLKTHLGLDIAIGVHI